MFTNNVFIFNIGFDRLDCAKVNTVRIVANSAVTDFTAYYDFSAGLLHQVLSFTNASSSSFFKPKCFAIIF